MDVHPLRLFSSGCATHHDLFWWMCAVGVRNSALHKPKLGSFCQNGGTTGGTQVACNLGGIRGFAVVRGDWKNKHHEHSYACALLSDTFLSRK
jgi:hypothetical protein